MWVGFENNNYNTEYGLIPIGKFVLNNLFDANKGGNWSTWLQRIVIKYPNLIGVRICSS